MTFPTYVAIVLVGGALVGCQRPRSTPTPVAGCPSPVSAALAWQASERFSDPVATVCLSPTLTAAVDGLAEDVAAQGVAVDNRGKCDLSVDLVLDGAAPAGIPTDWRDHGDGYAWSARRDGTTLALTVYAKTARGARYAVDALLASRGALPAAAADWPAFDRRGIIEGFYNRYFTRDERATTLGLMRRLRQNSYLYAPKDDRYAGYRWSESYPAEAADDLRAAAASAARYGIDFVWGISPTLSTNGEGPEASIRFSSSDDFARLAAKLESVRALGVSRFAIQFDDASGQLYHAEDRAAFSSPAAAHADLANRVVAQIGGPLLFVGVAYNSRVAQWEEYNGELGRLLDPAIEVMWTGPETFSKSIQPSDLTEIDQLLQRKVVLWDNWPISAAPVTGRDPMLASATAGILTNATLVGDFGHPVGDFWRVLGPVADYAWRPDRYDAEASFSAWQSLLPTMQTCIAADQR
jgi:beta-N-acetylglucosaminidase